MKSRRAKERGRQIIALFRYTLFAAGIGIFAYAALTYQYNLEMAGIIIFFAGNVFFGFAEGRTRYIFLFFHLAVFTFLLGLPMIRGLLGETWWTDFGRPATREAMIIIFLSLVSLRLGAVLGDGIAKRLEQNAKRRPAGRSRNSAEYREAFLHNLQIVSLIVFGVTIALSFLTGAEQLLFMRGKTYNEFFLVFESRLPYFVITLASMSKYALCIYLATFPKKKPATIVLIIFLADALPSLFIGVRNPLILRLMFSLIYYICRDTAGSEEKWIGLKEKAAVLIGAPVAVVLLSVYASIRVGKSAKGGILYFFVRFFYNQGVTFDTVRGVVRSLDKLPNTVPKNYTFGMFIDYFKYGTLGQKLFGMPAIGDTNSALKAVYGNDLAHSYYYAVSPAKYLQGWGKGSSYVAENYADGGYAGVIIFSLALGTVLILLTVLLKMNNTLVRTIVLVSLLGLFFIPRAQSSSWIAFLVYFQFWALVIAVYFTAGLFVRGYLYKKRNAAKEILSENAG